MNEIVKHERWTKAEDLTLLTMHQSGQSIFGHRKGAGKVLRGNADQGQS